MAISTKQDLYSVKFRRNGFTFRHSKNLPYRSALATMRCLNNQGIAARVERQ
jgi:hypothetical protein